MQQAQQASQQQFQQLKQYNDRITSLRGLIMSSTGQSADNVRILEQLRSLRSDLGAFHAQTGGVMQTQIQDFVTRLNQLNPSFAEGTAGGTNSTAAGTAGSNRSSGLPSTATNTASGAPR